MKNKNKATKFPVVRFVRYAATAVFGADFVALYSVDFVDVSAMDRVPSLPPPTLAVPARLILRAVRSGADQAHYAERRGSWQGSSGDPGRDLYVLIPLSTS